MKQFPILKLCPICGEYKDPTQYHKHTKVKSGLQTYCKDCKKKQYELSREGKEKRKEAVIYAEVPPTAELLRKQANYLLRQADLADQESKPNEMLVAIKNLQQKVDNLTAILQQLTSEMCDAVSCAEKANKIIHEASILQDKG